MKSSNVLAATVVILNDSKTDVSEGAIEHWETERALVKPRNVVRRVAESSASKSAEYQVLYPMVLCHTQYHSDFAHCAVFVFFVKAEASWHCGIRPAVWLVICCNSDHVDSENILFRKELITFILRASEHENIRGVKSTELWQWVLRQVRGTFFKVTVIAQMITKIGTSM